MEVSEGVDTADRSSFVNLGKPRMVYMFLLKSGIRNLSKSC